MKRTLHLEIVAGEKICASGPGEFCPHVRVSHFGTRFSCAMFDQEKALPEKRGWLHRHPACIAAEVK